MQNIEFPQFENYGVNFNQNNRTIPVNASYENRVAHGMDEGVQRIDYGIFNHYEKSLMKSLSTETSTGEKALGFIDLKPENYKVLSTIYLTESSNTFNSEWYFASMEYVNNLPPEDKFMLRAYTRNGDELINTLIRTPDEFDTKMKKLIDKCIYSNTNNVIAVQLFLSEGIPYDEYFTDNGLLTIPGMIVLARIIQYLPRDSIKVHVAKLAAEIKRIIEKAPRSLKPIRLYRGVKTDYLKEYNTEFHQLTGLQSMSYSTDVALEFSSNYNKNDKQNHRMIYAFTIDANIPCIAMKPVSHFPQENEVLVSMDLYTYVPDVFYEKIQLTSESFNYHNVFPPYNDINNLTYPNRSIYVKFMTLVKGAVKRRSGRYSMESNSNNNSVNNVANNGVNNVVNKPRRGGRITLKNIKQQNNLFIKKLNNKTRRFNYKLNKPQMNKQKIEKSTLDKPNINALMKTIKNIEANENDFSKVRDSGLGFVIVKDAKIPQDAINRLKQMSN